jgi:hypothetical protein
MREIVQYRRNISQPTVSELLVMRATQQPCRVAYTFIASDGEEEQVTYAELEERARAIGCQFSELVMCGKPVALLYPPGISYITALFGCIAVPAYPPDPLRQAWEPVSPDPESAALLQYTSGSTATPKGVVLTHRNLMNNSGLIYRFFGHSQDSRGMLWLPPYHDMGLIGGIIQPLYGGFPITLMAPADFMQRPARWLQEISRIRVTTSGGPNFFVLLPPGGIPKTSSGKVQHRQCAAMFEDGQLPVLDRSTVGCTLEAGHAHQSAPADVPLEPQRGYQHSLAASASDSKRSDATARHVVCANEPASRWYRWINGSRVTAEQASTDEAAPHPHCAGYSNALTPRGSGFVRADPAGHRGEPAQRDTARLRGHRQMPSATATIGGNIRSTISVPDNLVKALKVLGLREPVPVSPR